LTELVVTPAGRRVDVVDYGNMVGRKE
jgi:hypothetical protein